MLSMTQGKHLPRVEIFCFQCGKKFSRIGSDTDRRHCSFACAKETNKAAPPRKFNCEYCGKEAFAIHKLDQRFCSRSCGRRSYNINQKLKLRANGYLLAYREAKANLLQQFMACQRCGWNTITAVLELHYIDRNRGNNHISNLALLCPNCHAIEHFEAGDGQFKNNLGRIT
jgi:hypothetical protein